MLIAVAAAGDVDVEGMAQVEACLNAIEGVKTVRMEPMPGIEYARDPLRRQYSSTLVLREAVASTPAGADRILVVTERDIFIPMLSFVYGQAQLGGAAAVLSFARLRQEFYGLPSNRPAFLKRVRKETLHEMGHTFGLTHCSDPLCAMALSTNLQQLDVKADAWCESCAVLLGDTLQ